MADYGNIPVRKLPDGPAHLTNTTRWKHKWMYDWQESEKELRANQAKQAKKKQKKRRKRRG